MDLESTSSHSHFYDYEVTAGDIDELGHASNIAVVRWIQEAAISHSNAVGLELATYRRLGGIFVVRRHEVDYLRSPVRGDRLAVRTWVATVRAASTFRMTEFKRPDGVVAVSSKTTWAFIDIASGRPRRIPDDVRRVFESPIAGLVIGA